jgi:hypothetical protein
LIKEKGEIVRSEELSKGKLIKEKGESQCKVTDESFNRVIDESYNCLIEEPSTIQRERSEQTNDSAIQHSRSELDSPNHRITASPNSTSPHRQIKKNSIFV